MKSRIEQKPDLWLLSLGMALGLSIVILQLSERVIRPVDLYELCVGVAVVVINIVLCVQKEVP